MRSVRISTKRFFKIVLATLLLAILLSCVFGCTPKDQEPVSPTTVTLSFTPTPRVIFILDIQGNPIGKFISSNNPKLYDSGTIIYEDYELNTEVAVKAAMFVEMPLDKYTECLKSVECKFARYDIDQVEE